MFEHPDQLATVVDALMAPADVAAWATMAAPGADVVGPLAVLDPVRMDDAARVDLLVGLDRQIAWLQAAQQRVLAAIDGTVPDRDGEGLADVAREQVGAALRLSPGTAADRLAIARTLTDRLPATLRLLERGEITYLHARRLAEAVLSFDDPTAGAIEGRVLAHAPQQTLAQFTASVRRAVLAADPRSAEARHTAALAERRVVVTPQPDGMAELWALLPAEGVAVIKTVLDSHAGTKGPGETRTADQRRADALVDVFARALADPALPGQHGMRPAIQVTVAASTLLGCDEAPAELDGHGPITAEQGRRLAADETGTWRRLVTDPQTGQLLDYGRTAYRPPKDLAEHVIARDRTCVFPGCRRASRRCDLDHLRPYQTGGTTSPHNLAPLCRRHHRAKHEARWAAERQPDGTYVWTAPTRHRYAVTPPARAPNDA